MTLTFDTCVACEQIRPELDGKLIILGYFGVCPDVDVSVRRLDQPTMLTFLISGHGGEGAHVVTVDIVDDTDKVIAAAAAIPFEAEQSRRTDFGPTFLVVFERTGIFAVRCIVDGTELYRTHFKVSQA